MSDNNQEWSPEDSLFWTQNARTATERALKSQGSELNRMRWRSIALLISTSAIGLFIYPSIFTVLSIILGAGMLLWLLSPYWKFSFSLDANALLRWQNGDHPAPNLQEAETALTQHLSDTVNANAKTLRILRGLYASVIIISLLILSLSAVSSI